MTAGALRGVGKVGAPEPKEVTPRFKSAVKEPRKWIAGHVSKEWKQARQSVMARSDGFCEVRTPMCDARANQVHHIKRRSQGGPDEPGNLLATCASCHDWIHANVAESKRRGWLA